VFFTHGAVGGAGIGKTVFETSEVITCAILKKIEKRELHGNQGKSDNLR